MAAAPGAAAAAAAAAIVAAAMAEAAEIDMMLLHCGFTDPQQRLDISRDGFVGYADMNILREKDISELAKAFADRTQANGRITFGLRRQNLLKSTIHWVQDFRRVSRTPTLNAITDVNDFRTKMQSW